MVERLHPASKNTPTGSKAEGMKKKRKKRALEGRYSCNSGTPGLGMVDIAPASHRSGSLERSTNRHVKGPFAKTKLAVMSGSSNQTPLLHPALASTLCREQKSG